MNPVTTFDIVMIVLVCAMLGAIVTLVAPYIPAMLWVAIGSFALGVTLGINIK